MQMWHCIYPSVMGVRRERAAITQVHLPRHAMLMGAGEHGNLRCNPAARSAEDKIIETTANKDAGAAARIARSPRRLMRVPEAAVQRARN